MLAISGAGVAIGIRLESVVVPGDVHTLLHGSLVRCVIRLLHVDRRVEDEDEAQAFRSFFIDITGQIAEMRHV